jgi:hypothetical protein
MIKVCPICGKQFETTEKRIKDGRGKYCSKKCQFESMKKQIQVKCSICNKDFKITESKYKKNKTSTFFCKECWEERKQKKYKICLICGKHFVNRKNKYCSNECAQKAKLKKNEIIIKDNYAKIIINSKKWGIKQVLISLEDIEKVKLYTWQLYYCKDTNFFYVRSSQCNKKSIPLHRYLLNCPDDMVVDHINHNPLDNRRENIRIVTAKINANNVEWNKKNKTGYVGITKTKSGKFHVFHSKISLGTYKNLEDAVKIKSEYVKKITNGQVEYKNKGNK